MWMPHVCMYACMRACIITVQNASERWTIGLRRTDGCIQRHAITDITPTHHNGWIRPSIDHPSIHTAYSIHSWKQKNQNAQRAESHLEQSRPVSAKPHVERAEQEQDTSHENGIAERDYDALPCLEQQVHAAREQCSPH